MTQPQPDPVVAQTLLAVAGAAYITNTVTTTTTGLITALWRRINPYNAVEVADFAKKAGRLVIGSQKTVANAHTAAQLLQLKAMGINRSVTVTIPDNVRGSAVTFGKTPKVTAPSSTTIDYQDGAETVPKREATPENLFERAAEKYRYEKSVGKDDAAANDAAEQRISSLIDDNMILSARLAAQQTLKLVSDKDSRITGYRRVIHPELSKGGVCGMCVAAADRMYFVSELQPIHKRCNCTIAPVTKSHDPGFTLNQDDLERLYSHAADLSPEQRATSAAALKKTRYQLVTHHELGPVLTRVSGEQVPYLSATQSSAA